jgi:ligand-binding SRPBCC domain-containing protein
VSIHRLERTQVVPRPRAEVFAFFADPWNLERITPPFLRFRILTPHPLEVKAGALIDYRLSLFGLPFGWRTVIEAWEPGVRFVDRQLRGPYRRWHHTHAFEDAPGGTRMTDRVEYELPLGELARVLLVDRQLAAIFDHRRRAIGRLLGG